jgi:hypothetical protein
MSHLDASSLEIPCKRSSVNLHPNEGSRPKQVASHSHPSFPSPNASLEGTGTQVAGLAILLVVTAEPLQVSFYKRGHDEHLGVGLEGVK